MTQARSTQISLEDTTTTIVFLGVYVVLFCAAMISIQAKALNIDGFG
jgi:hypothetical protein